MSDQFLGEIRMLSFNFPPKNWALCNGQILAIATNQALFALFGTSFGGNGVTTYGLPNLQARAPMGAGSNTPGVAQGEFAHTLLANEVPPHTHQFMGTKTAGTSQQPAVGGWLGAYDNGFLALPSDPTQQTTLDPSCISTVGQGLPHENRQPFLCINFSVALAGVFPSRN